MKTLIVDRDALMSITPLAIRSYIQAQNWKLVGRYHEYSDIFRNGVDHSPELVVPATEDLADYADVMQDILNILSDYEKRSQLSIYQDLMLCDSDLIRFRIPEANDDGSISLNHGVDFVQQSYNLLLAAACSTYMPQASYRAGKIKEAAEFIHSIRMGQTERGSYVLTLLSPVPPKLDLDKSLFPELLDEEPHNRRVTLMLAKSLGALKSAMEEVNRGLGIAAFQNNIDNGVSANLCQAAANLVNNGNSIDISLSWALTRPAKLTRQRFTFSYKEGATLSEAAKYLRDQEPRTDEQLSGYVDALNRKQDDNEGRVNIKTFIDGKPNSVKVNLDSENYKIAISAHEKKQGVTIEGDLQREGQRWRLLNPRNLKILPDILDTDD